MKSRFKKIKKKIRKKISAKALSYIAIAISISSVYFQFFHINHEIKYASLYPILNEEKRTLTFPILLKNSGNQVETILDFQLSLEAKNNNESFYKRISELNEKEFFSILEPGDSKRIDLIGNYNTYLFGTIIAGKNDFDYKPISEFENLHILLKTTYLTKEGVVATEERIVGKLTFNANETIKRIDCPPTELKSLDLGKDDFEITQYSLIPDNKEYNNLSIDFRDSLSIKKNLGKLLFLEKTLKSDSIENKETLLILKKILKPYR
ncbi:hypothetical protein [uncultured Aquimarina sp.]|uniref:hypothetical protein n=1 Tax=uncultured Aquimarina sp. TaxID=575652 RepID=UPI00262F8124|nr:hypothetical protein [uncultured Aquimarina sp.]